MSMVTAQREADHLGTANGATASGRLADWVLKRGVLFVLTTAPLGALFLGLFRIRVRFSLSELSASDHAAKVN